MQNITVSNQDMKKALDHLSKLIELEDKQQQLASIQTSYSSIKSSKQNEYQSNTFNKDNDQIMNGKYIIRNGRNSDQYNSIEKRTSFFINNQIQSPTNYQYSEQNDSNQKIYQSVQSSKNEEFNSQVKNFDFNISYPTSIEQSQTDPEYLEEIKKLVQVRQGQLNTNNSDYESQKSKINFDGGTSQNIQKNTQNDSQVSSSSSEEENNEQVNDIQEIKQSLDSKNNRSKDVYETSQRLFQDGKVREKKKSLKKIEQQLDQCYQNNRQITLNTQSKKIIEKKMEQGEYEPIQKRWNTLLQEKADKMLEAKHRKNQIQEQIENKDLTFKPEINHISQQMSKKRTSDQVIHSLFKWNKKKLDKLFNQQFNENEKIAQELTFHPKINEQSAKLMENNETDDVVKRLYKKMELAEYKKEQQKQLQFNAKYTFKPQVNQKSQQIIQDQNFRSQSRTHDRSLTPGFDNIRKRIETEPNGDQQNLRSKTPTKYNSYSRSITPQLKGRKNQHIPQNQLKTNANFFDPNYKENHYTPVNDDSSSHRITQFFNNQNQSQRNEQSHSYQKTIKKSEKIIEPSINSTQQYHNLGFLSNKDRILQQTTEKLNTLKFTPQKQEGNSILRNYYSPSINSSLNTHSPEIIYQKLETNKKKPINQYQQFTQDLGQSTLKFNETNQQQNILANNQYSSSYSKSPNRNTTSNQINSLYKPYIFSQGKYDETGLNRSKTSLSQKYDCCPNGLHINTQEIEFNKKLQFLIDLISSEEKKQYQSTTNN